jgi:prepilin-type N-terminal cleavage/methylation domain-containing protein
MSVSALHRRLSAQNGFTVVELLVAMSIGTIVLMAAFMTLDRSNQLQAEVADRADALQRGRLALELATRQLRSQVCLGEATEPITVGQPTTISFYADMSDGTRNPEKRQLTFDSTAKTLVENRYTGAGTYPNLTFSATPSSTRVIGTGLAPVKVSGVDQPIFRYYAWRDGGQPGEMEELATPLTTTDVARTVMVKVTFVAQPRRLRSTTAIKNQDATTLENQAYIRSADPSKPKEGPKCL